MSSELISQCLGCAAIWLGGAITGYAIGSFLSGRR